MSSSFTLVPPTGWTYDLPSIYAAYLAFFQTHSIPWYARSWAPLFSSLPSFLAFSWPALVVTDATTGRAHIVTRPTSLNAFCRMVKTRFGESLPTAPPGILRVVAYEGAPRPLRTVTDWGAYVRLVATLPATALHALKARVRNAEARPVRALWEARDRTFCALAFRGGRRVREWGYAAVRCAHLDA
jgi:hypothetical protein